MKKRKRKLQVFSVENVGERSVAGFVLTKKTVFVCPEEGAVFFIIYCLGTETAAGFAFGVYKDFIIEKAGKRWTKGEKKGIIIAVTEFPASGETGFCPNGSGLVL